MSAALPLRTVAAGSLLQHVSRTRYRGGALHFGTAAANRYDAPDGSYGVLYLADDLDTALMESVFHQHAWSRKSNRTITFTEVRARMVRLVQVLQALELADLTAPGVMSAKLGMNLNQLTSRKYGPTQRISRQVHGAVGAAGVPKYDGLVYPSRNNYPASCVALFDRAMGKVKVHTDLDLDLHVDWPGFVTRYQIAVI